MCTIPASILIWVGFPWARELALAGLVTIVLELVILAIVAGMGHEFTSSQLRWFGIIGTFGGGFVINRVLDGSRFESWAVHAFGDIHIGYRYLWSLLTSALLLGIVTGLVIKDNHD